MVENPDEDTEPHVQRLFIGSYRETGMWSQDLASVGFCVYGKNKKIFQTYRKDSGNRRCGLLVR